MFSFRALEYCEEGYDDGVEQWMEMRFDHSNLSRNQTEKILKRIIKQKIDHVAIGIYRLTKINRIPLYLINTIRLQIYFQTFLFYR